MTIQTIPLQPIPNQQVRVVLGTQQVIIALQSIDEGIMVSINVNGVDFVNSVIAADRLALVAAKYLGFVGQLIFFDNQGTSNPTYDGLNSRYMLAYLDDDSYAAFLLANVGD